MSAASPPNHVAPSDEMCVQNSRRSRCGWDSLRQFGQVDFLPMFMVCTRMLKRVGGSLRDRR